MKHFFQFLLIALLLLITCSCSEEPFRNFGFDSDFNVNSDGLVMIHIGNKTENIHLEGIIHLESGKMIVEFLNPNSENAFVLEIESPGFFQIDEDINAFPGIWKLEYQSKNGVGTIDLHAAF
jgi:hypothetical protein